MVAPLKSLDPHSDAPSQADTPMTDANEEITSVPVDSTDAQMTVSDAEMPALPHLYKTARISCLSRFFIEILLRSASYFRATGTNSQHTVIVWLG